MNFLFSLVFILLVISSSGTHTYYLLKMKDYRSLKVHIGIMTLAIITGIFLIFFPHTYSIASVLNELSPLNN